MPLHQNVSVEVLLEVLDIQAEILSRFGASLVSDEESSKLLKEMQVNLIALLSHTRAAVRKRAMQALSFLSLYLSDDLYASTVQTLVDNCKANVKGMEELKSYFCAITAIRFVHSGWVTY